ncbi:radical SAM protein [candidate division KSB1 bacterium]|nr:radical SAM protein [candidate division KSB1 bacterium]
MTDNVKKLPLPSFGLWRKSRQKRVPLSFDLEITARCNNRCRHCYINLPPGDRSAREKELTGAEIDKLAGDAVELGALWCLITGGEPLLRRDFTDIYMILKKKGLLVSLFTNAVLVDDRHIELLRAFPPREVEVSVYGATRETYERVTGCPGSYDAFIRGVDKLAESGICLRFKAMALQSNIHEIPLIEKFCRQHTDEYFRYDPLLHLRFDGDEERNKQIKTERLTPEQIVELEQSDPERAGKLEIECNRIRVTSSSYQTETRLFYCGAGRESFHVSYDGKFRLCSSLWHPDTLYDLRQGTLREAWYDFVPRIRNIRSEDPELQQKCRQCTIINLCMWCPAHAHLETGRMDAWVDYFCRVAHARARAAKMEMESVK